MSAGLGALLALLLAAMVVGFYSWRASRARCDCVTWCSGRCRKGGAA